MSVQSVQATFAATLVDEWVAGGMTDAVVCPGSRSTPLALALDACTGMSVHVRLDERGAGFYAIGLARATGRAVVVCTTSGTAAAELHPAVVEAHYSRVGLVVCTADRPVELHDVGAPQTISQSDLFGSAVRWSAEPGVPHAAASGTWRSLAARALAEALRGPYGPGPVHLNLAFDDPLTGDPGPLPPGRPSGRPASRVVGGAGPAQPQVVDGWVGRRGLIVAGAGCGGPGAVMPLADRLGWPVLADPGSSCRVARPGVVAAADALARTQAVRASLIPDVVLLLGELWVSKALGELIAAAADRGAEVVSVDPWWRWSDPDRVVCEVQRAEVDPWLKGAFESLASSVGRGADRRPPGWRARWQEAEAAAQHAIDHVLAKDTATHGDRLSEPAVARSICRFAPAGATVVVASSMPLRDLEWFSPPLDHEVRVLANRGANGIDGVCATAFGTAASGHGHVIGLVGDLAFFHDVSSLFGPSGWAENLACTLVVLDNDGGGIFSFLPQAATVQPARFETLFGTPQSVDVAEVARGFRLAVADAGTPSELDAALTAAVSAQGLHVVRVRVPGRTENVAIHDEIHAAVADATSRLARSRS